MDAQLHRLKIKFYCEKFCWSKTSYATLKPPRPRARRMHIVKIALRTTTQNICHLASALSLCVFSLKAGRMSQQ